MRKYESSYEWKKIIFIERLDKELSIKQVELCKELIEKLFLECVTHYKYKQAKLGIGKRLIRLEFSCKSNHSKFAYTMLQTLFSSKAREEMTKQKLIWFNKSIFETVINEPALRGSVVEDLYKLLLTPKSAKQIEKEYTYTWGYDGAIKILNRMVKMGLLTVVTPGGQGYANKKTYIQSNMSIYLSEEYLI